MPGHLLLRHAACDNPAGFCLGQRDLPLSAAGEAQARELHRRWAGEWPTRVWCSDLRRARQTAELLLAGTGIRARPDTRLREIHLGDWQGGDWDSLYREQPQQLQRWGEHWLDEAPPGGESGRSLYRRVAEWARECLDPDGEPTLVVAHAGSLRALACALDDRGPEHLFERSFSLCAPVCWV